MWTTLPPGDLTLGDTRGPSVRTVRTVPEEPTAEVHRNWHEPAAEERDPGDKTLWRPPVPVFTYLAGAAGCGKTFATKDWATREPGLILCATTGIAAINVGGTTINSLLGYFDTKSLMEHHVSGWLGARLGKLWKIGTRRIVLDEVSMLDGDQLTYLCKAIDEVNNRGYRLQAREDGDPTDDAQLGLTLVGDFCQLPPVNAPFAFESSEWPARFEADGAQITLTEIRRQADPAFIAALRACRRGDGPTVAAYLGDTIARTTDDRFEGCTLFAKNESVDRYNWIRMNQLPGRDLYYRSQREGKQRSEWGNPNKPPASWGIPEQLHLKVGALVMILANRRYDLSTAFMYVNGDLGEVVDGDPERHVCTVRLQRTGQEVEVIYVRREVLAPLDAARRKELIALNQRHKIAEGGRWEIEGWIEYLPLRVAYASTVHKSQGLSLDRVQVNLADAFFKSPGMVYVALSRARTAEGLRVVGSQAALVERCRTDPRLTRWL